MCDCSCSTTKAVRRGLGRRRLIRTDPLDSVQAQLESFRAQLELYERAIASSRGPRGSSAA